MFCFVKKKIGNDEFSSPTWYRVSSLLLCFYKLTCYHLTGNGFTYSKFIIFSFDLCKFLFPVFYLILLLFGLSAASFCSLFFYLILIVLFICSKSYCPFCVRVKKLFEQLGATFKAIELDGESEYTCLWFHFLCSVMESLRGQGKGLLVQYNYE